MKCIAGFNMMAFPVSKTLWHLCFLSKYNLLKCPNENQFKAHWTLSSEESKIERVTRHLQRLLHAAPIKETLKFQESWKEKYKWRHFDEKENKMFCAFAGNFQLDKKHALFLQTRTSNFQTDSLKAHEVNEASEGHVMISVAKHASERPREERPLPTLPAALSRLKPKTAVELIKLLLLLHTCVSQLLSVTGKKLLKCKYVAMYH